MNNEASSAKPGFWNAFGQLVGIGRTCKVFRNLYLPYDTCCTSPSDTLVITILKLKLSCADTEAVNFTRNHRKVFYLNNSCPEGHFGHFQ